MFVKRTGGRGVNYSVLKNLKIWFVKITVF